MDLDVEKIDRGSSTISRIIYYVSADGKPCSIEIPILQSLIYYNPAVCHVLPTGGGDVLFVYEKNCICSFYPPWHSLRQASQLISIRFSPELTIFRIFHEVSHLHYFTSILIQHRIEHLYWGFAPCTICGIEVVLRDVGTE